jgi:hypothetical protein
MLQCKRSFAAVHRPISTVLRDECVFSKIINHSDRFDVESSLGFSCLYWRKMWQSQCRRLFSAYDYFTAIFMNAYNYFDHRTNECDAGAVRTVAIT